MACPLAYLQIEKVYPAPEKVSVCSVRSDTRLTSTLSYSGRSPGRRISESARTRMSALSSVSGYSSLSVRPNVEFHMVMDWPTIDL